MDKKTYTEADFHADMKFYMVPLIMTVLGDDEWKCQRCGKPNDNTKELMFAGGYDPERKQLQMSVIHRGCESDTLSADVVFNNVGSIQNAGEAVMHAVLDLARKKFDLPIIVRPGRYAALFSGSSQPVVLFKGDDGKTDAVECYMPIYDTDPTIIGGRMAREALALSKAVKAGKAEVFDGFGDTAMLTATPEVFAEIFAKGGAT